MVDKTRLLLFALVIWAVPLGLFAAAARLDGADREEHFAGESGVKEEGAVKAESAAERHADTGERSPEEHSPEELGAGGSTVNSAVRKGCIASHLIRRVSFDDDRTGILELVGRQRVRLTLRNACSGIRFNGYVHKPVNRRFCEGDTLRVMSSGGFCVVDSLEPLADGDIGEAEGQSAGER